MCFRALPPTKSKRKREACCEHTKTKCAASCIPELGSYRPFVHNWPVSVGSAKLNLRKVSPPRLDSKMLHGQWPLSVWEASLLAQISFETSKEHDKLNCICIICFCMSDTELIVYSFRCVRFQLLKGFKGMFANPRVFSMICAHLNCSLRQGHSSFVVRCLSRIANWANFGFGSPVSYVFRGWSLPEHCAIMCLLHFWT